MKKPICEKCVEAKQKYSVTEPMSGMTTLMCPAPGRWDEEGNYHEGFDPNTTTYTYTCSNGHSWDETTYNITWNKSTT